MGCNQFILAVVLVVGEVVFDSAEHRHETTLDPHAHIRDKKKPQAFDNEANRCGWEKRDAVGSHQSSDLKD